MTLSKELETGKAGEYFVCFDLIRKGFHAFLTDQGSHFDNVVEINGKLFKVQVKTTKKTTKDKRGRNVLRFSIREGKKQKYYSNEDRPDFIACVYLDSMKVGYFTGDFFVNKKTKRTKQIIELKTKEFKYNRRVYSNGTTSKIERGVFIEDYCFFPPKKIKGV